MRRKLLLKTLLLSTLLILYTTKVTGYEKVLSKKDIADARKAGYTWLGVSDFLSGESRFEKIQFYSRDKFAVEKIFDLKTPDKNYEVSNKGKLILEKSSHTKKIVVGRNTPMVIRKIDRSDVLKGILYSSKLPILAKEIYENILKTGLIRVFFEKSNYILFSSFKPLYANDFMSDIFQEDQYLKHFVPVRVSPLSINFGENETAANECSGFYVIIGNIQSLKEELYCASDKKVIDNYWNVLRYTRILKIERTVEKEIFRGVPVQNN